MNNLISIVIPHYNTPDTLLRLLRSIPMREDIEVIVVDDNSDIPLEELRRNIEVFPRVQLFRNDSGVKGAGASRNIALRKATGKWVLFADADDFFVNGLYEKLAPYLESDYDIVYFAPTSIDGKTGEESTRHVNYMGLVNRYCQNPTLQNQIALNFCFTSPCSKLLRLNLLKEHGIFFDEIMVADDVMCMAKCAYYSQKITATNEIIYCITRNEGTLTTKKTEEKFDMRVDVMIRKYCFLRENLSKWEFRYTYVDCLALNMLVEAITDHWGIRKLFAILRLYYKHRIKIFILNR